MNFIDIIIIILILVSGILGAKRGVLKELVICIGTILIFYLAYVFKDYLSEFLLLKLPFFSFNNFLKGAASLNILFYQTIAFILILSVLAIIYRLLLSITGIFEKILRLTIILGIPSKILGFLVGLIEGYVITFIVLFVLNQPILGLNFFSESNLSKTILTSSPVLSNVTNDAAELFYDIYELKDLDDKDLLDYKIIDMMLDKKFVKYDVINKLYVKKKINFENIEELLEKYKEIENA